jgi:hypothetical protein
MNSEATIRVGLDYVDGLKTVNRLIEAERLVTKLCTVSRQVLGSEHK